MITTIWILSIILYIIMGVIVGRKQAIHTWLNLPVETVLLGVIWPITLTVYIIRAVFFEDWI